MISRTDYFYYQPEWYHDDGTNIEYGGTPDGLWDFQAFLSEDECRRWLINNDYNPAEFVIHEYKNDDIEDVTIINEWGENLDRIEDLTDDEIADRIVDTVIWNAGSEDNLKVCKQDDETRDQFMDRAYTWAHGLIMDAISDIELNDDYNFQAYAGPCVGSEWYDEGRELAMQRVMEIMLEDVPYDDCYEA